ncbi:ABC transporter permease subunit [Roseovarius aestuarii]|nr:ABC transporter permease subunit [Roseovarius aestuarii]
MTQEANNPLPEEAVRRFVGTNPDYYLRLFRKIGDSTRPVLTFNWAAVLLGATWFGMRNLWALFLVSVVFETIAVVQIARGAWGDLGAPLMERLGGIEKTLAMRHEQLAEALANAPEKVAMFKSTIASLEGAIETIKVQAQAARNEALTLVLLGFALLVLVKIAQGIIANPALRARYVRWRSKPTLQAGLHTATIALATGLALATYVICALRFGFPGQIEVLREFPTDPSIQSDVATAIKDWMRSTALSTEWFFDGLVSGISAVLDALETLFVETPWPVMGGFTILLTGLSAGWRGAIFTTAALAYLGYLGFWEKSMQTLALLGTAAFISISLGIPLGVACARNLRLYTFVRPILDFMQTMPAFVYLIPVIAFFGTGKPAAIVATMIFGGTPVVRLTVLGLRGVPHSVREAAMAFGASKRYLLWKVDLPLAAPSIMAGINQTILLSLAMVVIASLIGAKGLGEDVLEALQYASEGQGILAGIAILFCAMILDRIIQGKGK